ncbi:hypothetical protein CL634_03915 [bacterium]|nr:hypothetical protein [bacterium]|tara:strand:+ start:121 stop:378 length:258 start_codon:yes stop_codon:yes gene_type:complete
MNLEQEVSKIKARNTRVEADKAWETSVARRSLITLLTYSVIVIFMHSIDDPNPLYNAVVPTAAFMLSTLIAPFARKKWLKKVYKK